MTPEEVADEIRAMRMQLSVISIDLKVLVNEVQNQAKGKEILDNRITTIERERGPTRDEFNKVENRVDYTETQLKIRKREVGMTRGIVYFVGNTLVLVLCSYLTKIM